jgi:hypothetical protein
MNHTPAWLVLAWRLPAGPSTPRVTTWRNLRRIGAAHLTPGAAALPYREDLQEQLEWIAQEIETLGGEAWVLPVTELSESEERIVRERMAADRDAEYRALEDDALIFLARRASGNVAEPLQIEKELLALQRRFRKIRARDYAGAPSRSAAARSIDRCLAYRQGISPKLVTVTDPEDTL